jgi:hypothetical protein
MDNVCITDSLTEQSVGNKCLISDYTSKLNTSLVGLDILFDASKNKKLRR